MGFLLLAALKMSDLKVRSQDTKYEFGLDDKGVIHVIDEALHGPA